MCHFIVTLLFLFAFGTKFGANAKKVSASANTCVFPEARERPFFFDIPTDVPARSILVDTVVEPSDAKLTIANIRSNNLEPDVDLDAQLALEKRANGQFLVITAVSPPVVHFADYPSIVNETLLYITVRCNGRLYPLMTVRVRNANMHSPEFLGTQPYEISVARNALAGTLYETPLKALDLDPADQYPITFAIQPPFDRDFALVTVATDADQQPTAGGVGRSSSAEEARLLATLPPAYSKRVEHWHRRQMPPAVQLKVLAKSLSASGKSVYYLNVTAKDNGQPEPRVAYAQLKVSVKEAREAAARFSRSEYFANFTKEMVPGTDLPPNGDQPIVATFPAQRIGDRVRYNLDLQANPYAQLFELDPWTGRLRLAQRVPDGVPPTLELDLTARLIPRDSVNGIDTAGIEEQSTVHTKITLTDQTEVRLTYFAQCHYDAHLAENPSAYTRVLHFNYRGDVQEVELLNGTDLFKVDSEGMMIVRPGVDIDRENTDRIIVKARLRSRSPLHPRSLELCQIATADIRIDDVNDHSPRFTRRAYRFRIDAHPFNNTEVGPLRAVDGDKGEFGRVRYRLLEEFVPDGKGGEEPLPFVLFQADGAATIFYVVKPLHLELLGNTGGAGGGQQQYQPQADYTFTVEAYDSMEDPRTSRVTVNVRLADLTEHEAEREREEAMRERQQEQQQHQQFELQQDQPSTQMDVEEEEQHSAVDDQQQTRMALPSAASQHQRHNNLAEQNRRAHAVATLVLDGTGAKQQFGNKFGNLLPPDGGDERQSAEGLVRFSADKYTFRLRGPLTEGQTIGMVQAKRMDGSAELEFAVEEGIAGFVGVESNTGRLFVGPWLLRDRFEEIRFSVAAQHPSGQVLATALVSVLIDDLGPPEFSAPHYQFELDQAGEAWPRLVGQVKAIPFTGGVSGQQNGTTNSALAAVGDGSSPSAMFFYAFDDDQRPNDSSQRQLISASRWFEVDEQTGQINATGAPPIGVNDRRKTVKFGVKACLRANGTICGRSSVEVVVFNSNDNAAAAAGENSADADTAVVPRIEFIPLPRTVFLTTGKQPGSAILRVSVREFDLRDGSWRLLPLSSDSRTGDDDQPQRLRVVYSVTNEGDDLPQQQKQQQLFHMHDNVLTLVGRAVPGEYNLTIRATAAQSPSMDTATTPEEWTRRRLAIAARRTVVQHSLRVIVMRAEDGRQRYPVFERISYEFVIDPPDQHQRYPVAMHPPLNASLADGSQPIRFTMFPARAGDPPTDGIEIDEPTGQLWVHRRFVDAAISAIANRSSGSDQSPSSPVGTEVFIVVRATNRAQPEFFSDASVALLVRPGQAGSPEQSMPEFDALLYRMIVREDAPVGTVLNGGTPIALVEPARHPLVQLKLRPATTDDQTTAALSSSLINHFQLLDNGLVVLVRPLDIEQMDDTSKGVIELEVVAVVDHADHFDHADQPQAHARVQIQVVDVDEFAPRFDQSSPEFHLQAPLLIAGQPIGHLRAHDDDFSDRQPGSLLFRAILGNASELVHVQRDGTLLVKDPKSWQLNRAKMEPTTLFLLVEVRGNSGQTSSTTVKFVIDEQQENETAPDEDRSNQDTDTTNTLTTLDSRGTTMDFTAIPAPEHALFSVRDSLSPDQLVEHRAGQLQFRLDEPTARMGLFRVDANTGELYMEDNTAFNGMPAEETEHELGVEVVDIQQQQQQRVVARRTYTVRLVQRATMTTPAVAMSSRTRTTSSSSTATTTTTTTTAKEDETDGQPAMTTTVTVPSTEDTVETSMALVEQQETTTTTTASSSSLSSSSTSTTPPTTTPTMAPPSSSSVGTALVDELLAVDEMDEPFGTTTDILPSLSALPSATNSSPSAATARRAPTAEPLLVPFSSSPASSLTLASSNVGDSLKFALPRYHWIVSEPTRQALIGKLQMHGNDQMLDSIIIEPPQFRTWFQLDQKSGELYLREVPDQLYGRQRAEFRAHLTALDGHWADAVVVVDLNLPPKPGSTSTASGSANSNESGGGKSIAAGVGTSMPKSANGPQRQQQISTPSDIAIAESSDQASRTAAASDTKIGSLRPTATASSSLKPTALRTFPTRRTTATTSISIRHRYSSTAPSTTTTPSVTALPSTRFTTSRSVSLLPHSADHSRVRTTTDVPSDQSTEEPSGPDKSSTDQPSDQSIPQSSDQSSDQPSDSDQSSPSSRAQTITGRPLTTPTVDQQQNGLHFASDQYRAMLPEGRYGNSGALLSLRPQPLAQGMPRGVEYSIVTDAEQQQLPSVATSDSNLPQQQLPFFVRRDTGELIAFAEIDREEQAQYQFRVMAFDPAQNRSAETQVTVHILDVNDNFPQFVEPLPRVIALGRLSPPGTILAQFNAVDMDEGAHGTVRFLITSAAIDQEKDDGPKLFTMEPDGRLIFRGMPTAGQPDGAVQQQEIFMLHVLAVDGGRPALRTEHKLRIELFTEGQPPAFKQSDFVADRMPAGAAQNGTFVAQVMAGTSDQIEYSLIDPPSANLFLIDSHTGQVRMGRRPVDAERSREWVLHVLATEGHGQQAATARTTVHVFLESFRPGSVEEVEPDKLAPHPSSSTTATTNDAAFAVAAPGDGIVPPAFGECRFEERVFYSEIAENTEGRQRLVTLGTTDACAGHKVRFALQQNNDAFVLDEQFGDLYAVQPLDRERKSLYFLVANLLFMDNNNNNSDHLHQHHQHHSASSPSFADVPPFGLATVLEVQLEQHHSTEQQRQQKQTSSSSTAVDDGTIEEEEQQDVEESAGGAATNGKKQNKSHRKSRQTVIQPQLKMKSSKELFNGVVEQAKAKLTANQALILVHVLDRNDNIPQIEHLNVNGQIVFTVDWQLPMMGQIGRVTARDADEHTKLQYTLDNANIASSLFSINETTGVITLTRSLQSDEGAADEFSMNVMVSDGQHIAKAPLLIYKLQPGTNIVLLVINQPVDKVDVLRAVRHMNALLHGIDVDVLVKQVFIGEDGRQEDPRRTHLLVYAVDSRTRMPLPAAKLKELLDAAFVGQTVGDLQRGAVLPPAAGTETAAADSPLRFLASISVPDYSAAMDHSTFRLTTVEITLLTISVLLVFGVCAMLFMLLRCCKNKQQQTITKSDVEYMLDAQQAGPRPYNVELVTRKMAQSGAAAVARRLPKALEQCTLSPESRATMVASSGIYSNGSGGIAATMPKSTAAGGQRRGEGGATVQYTTAATGSRTVATGHPIADTSTTTTTTTTTSSSSSDRSDSGESSPQQQQNGGGGADASRSGEQLHNLLLLRRRNSRSGNGAATGGGGGGRRAVDKQQRRIVQPITYQNYDGIDDNDGDDGAGGAAAAMLARNDAIDDAGGPMQDTKYSSVEQSPEMARASGNGGGITGRVTTRAAAAVATLDEGGATAGTSRRGAPPREPPPPPGANAPPTTNIAGQRQQQAATIVGTSRASVGQ